ncbi:MAG: hypothetical protein ACRENT_01640, partial [Thermodesulfobacteriota bacterium]
LTAFSANTFTFGAFLQGGLQSAFLSGAQTLGYHLGIDPNLMSVASILAQPLFQGFVSGDPFGGLFSNLSNIAGGFASFGFNKLIQSFDWDPDLTMVVGDFFSPFMNDLAGGFVMGLMNPITPVIRQGEETGLTLTEALTNQNQGPSPPGGPSLTVDLRNNDVPPSAITQDNSYSYFLDSDGSPIAMRNPYTGALDPFVPSGAALLLGDVGRYYNPAPLFFKTINNLQMPLDLTGLVVNSGQVIGQKIGNNLVDWYQSDVGDVLNYQGDNYGNYTKTWSGFFKPDLNVTDGAGGIKLGGSVFEAGFERVDRDVIKDYTIGKKGTLDLVGADGKFGTDFKKLHYVELGGKIYVVKVAVEAKHEFGKIFGIKFQAEGTLGSFGREFAIGMKTGIGVHNIVGASGTVEFYIPKQETKK